MEHLGGYGAKVGVDASCLAAGSIQEIHQAGFDFADG